MLRLLCPVALVTVLAVPAAQEDPVSQDEAVSQEQAVPQADLLTAPELVKQLDASYATFTAEFTEYTNAEDRAKLTTNTETAMQALLEPHVTRAMIIDVLPELEHYLVVDLSPSFVRVIDEHAVEATRARALYVLARNFGHHRKLDACKSTLAFLISKYGKLKLDDISYAHLAERSAFYFEHLAVDCEAPVAMGEDEDGNELSLADYRGKVVILRFWGDWCPACRAMYPYERDLVDDLKGEPFVLLGVNSDPRERMQTAQKRSNLVWRSFWDGGDTAGEIANLFQVELWPTVVVIDAEGIVRARFEGFDSKGPSRKQLDLLLPLLVAEAKADVGTEEPARKR